MDTCNPALCVHGDERRRRSLGFFFLCAKPIHKLQTLFTQWEANRAAGGSRPPPQDQNTHTHSGDAGWSLICRWVNAGSSCQQRPLTRRSRRGLWVCACIWMRVSAWLSKRCAPPASSLTMWPDLLGLQTYTQTRRRRYEAREAAAHWCHFSGEHCVPCMRFTRLCHAVKRLINVFALTKSLSVILIAPSVWSALVQKSCVGTSGLCKNKRERNMHDLIPLVLIKALW